MIASVDQSGCIGCGMCEQTAQAISGEVPPHCEEAAKEAASNCPVSVIHID